jgi:hypothetical protein
VEHYLCENEEFAVAKSVDGNIGVTWNVSEDRPNGYPNVFGHQQWFILPAPLADLVLAAANVFPSVASGESDGNT